MLHVYNRAAPLAADASPRAAAASAAEGAAERETPSGGGDSARTAETSESGGDTTATGSEPTELRPEVFHAKLRCAVRRAERESDGVLSDESRLEALSALLGAELKQLASADDDDSRLLHELLLNIFAESCQWNGWNTALRARLVPGSPPA